MLTIISFLLFTAMVAVVAWWKTHDDRQDTATGYFLAGRSLVWPVIGGSLLLTNLSTEQLVGINGDGYRQGMLLMTWEVWSSLSIVAMALIFLPVYLRSGITTIPEFLEIRFDRRVRLFTSCISVVLTALILMPFILYSGAEFMIPVFNVPEYLGSNTGVNLAVVSGLLAMVGGCYAVFGGLKAVAVSDTVNGLGLAVGGLLIPVFGLSFAGHGSVMEGLSTIIDQHPERMSSMGDSDSLIPWQTLFTGVTLLTTFYWCTNQGIVQRTFAAKNLAEGQKGTLFAALMKLLGPLYLVLPGVIAWHIVSSGAYDIPADVSLPADSNRAYGFLVRLVLPEWAVGFFAATIFGAILSSFNSFLNSGSTLFGVDIYRGVINPQATDQQTVRAGRAFALVAIPLSVGLVLFFRFFAASNQGLFSQLINFISVTNIPLISIMFMALVSKRTPAIGVIVALIVGMTFQFVFGILGGGQLGLTINGEFHGIRMHGLHLAGVNFLLLVAVMLVFRILKPQERFEQQHSGDVDITPWKYARPAGMAIVAIVASMYLGLWYRFGLTPGAQVQAEYELLHAPAAATTEESGD